MTLDEGAVRFSFAAGVEVEHYDTWKFYKQHLKHLGAGGGSKGSQAVDFLCLKGPKVFLIEVKDFRDAKLEHNPPTPSELPAVVAAKVRDSIAGLWMLSRSSSSSLKRAFAARCIEALDVHVVLHLDQRVTPFRSNPQIYDHRNLVLKLKQQLRGLKPDVEVASTELPVQSLYHSSFTT